MANDEIVNVRYMVDDVEASIAFYTELLGFEVLTNAAPAFADVKRGNLRLLLSGPKSSAGRPMPDGATPGPGGWNRIHLIVDDIDAEVARLRDAGATFRNDVVKGPGGKQILLQDPSGNFVELFQPAAPLSVDRASVTPTTTHRRGDDGAAAAATRPARRGDRRRRIDDRRRRVQRVGPGHRRRRHGRADRPRRRRRRRVLQRHLLGAAGRRAPRVGRHLRLRPPPARPGLGLPRRVGVRRRQDRLVRRHRAHRRRLPVARPRPARRDRRGRRRGDRQHRRVDPHRPRHQGLLAVALVALGSVVSPAGRARRPRSRGSPRSTPRRPASCAPAGSCSSPSPATPASPPSARRSATRPPPSPRRSRAPWPACW